MLFFILCTFEQYYANICFCYDKYLVDFIYYLSTFYIDFVNECSSPANSEMPKPVYCFSHLGSVDCDISADNNLYSPDNNLYSPDCNLYPPQSHSRTNQNASGFQTNPLPYIHNLKISVQNYML